MYCFPKAILAWKEKGSLCGDSGNCFQLSAVSPDLQAEALQAFWGRMHLFFNKSAVHNKNSPMHRL